MSMGTHSVERQQQLWIATTQIAESPGHPFYRRLNRLLEDHGFDGYVEAQCGRFYTAGVGRRSIPPGVYFRMLLIGYFEGLESERGIAWRCGDSLALRQFLGYAVTDRTPDHSSLSRIRSRLDLETHEQVFGWVLKLLASKGLLKGKTIGVDATTLEANAAMRSIVRNDTGDSYEQFLTKLAETSGVETPTREDLAKVDKSRKNKASNDDWHNPHDPDAKIAKMKDGRTHLAHKAEHAVDLETEAVVSVTLQPADRGDCDSLDETLETTAEALAEVAEDEEAGEHISEDRLSETVTDKGYHSNRTMADQRGYGVRTYCSEPDRKKRSWKGKPAERAAVYANRRRIGGRRGKRLLRRRAEVVERGFAHCYETGGMRRTHLRGRGNILKRQLIHVAGFNLSLLMRRLLGVGTPRALAGVLAAVRRVFLGLLRRLRGLEALLSTFSGHEKPNRLKSRTRAAA